MHIAHHPSLCVAGNERADLLDVYDMVLDETTSKRGIAIGSSSVIFAVSARARNALKPLSNI